MNIALRILFAFSGLIVVVILAWFTRNWEPGEPSEE